MRNAGEAKVKGALPGSTPATSLYARHSTESMSTLMAEPLAMKRDEQEMSLALIRVFRGAGINWNSAGETKPDVTCAMIETP